MAEKEKTVTTGLEAAEDRKEAEYDLVKSLLSAMDYQADKDSITEAQVKRNGVFLFAVNMHPISDDDIRIARRKATTFMANPNGKKLPPIEKEVNNVRFKSLVIYAATTEEDRKKIWGNKAVMEKASLQEAYESIDVLLTAGEKSRLFDLVLEISGLNDEEEEVSAEEYAGN